jgi:hypothetical protein
MKNKRILAGVFGNSAGLPSPTCFLGFDRLGRISTLEKQQIDTYDNSK